MRTPVCVLLPIKRGARLRNNGTVLGPAACSVLDFLSYGVLAPASLPSTSGTFSTASHITCPSAVTAFPLSGLYRAFGLLEGWPRLPSFRSGETWPSGACCGFTRPIRPGLALPSSGLLRAVCRVLCPRDRFFCLLECSFRLHSFRLLLDPLSSLRLGSCGGLHTGLGHFFGCLFRHHPGHCSWLMDLWPLGPVCGSHLRFWASAHASF